MIIVPGKFIFVGSPRSGSHFISDGLQAAFPDAIRTKEHHSFIRDVLLERSLRGNLPIYSICREPVNWVFSFYYNLFRKYEDIPITTTFTQFIEGKKPQNVQYNRATDFPPGHLCTYQNVTTKYFPFEKNFKRFFDFIGVDVDALIANGLKASRQPEPEYLERRASISVSDRLLVEKYFKKDLSIYKAALNDTSKR